MAIHKCLEARGSAPGCSECPVMIKGFCNEFLIVLEKMAAYLNNKYGDQIPVAHREEILSETVLGVLTNLYGFEKRSTFSTWAWDIYLNKVIDYFRNRRKQNPSILKLTEESLAELKLKIPNGILSKLETMIDREYENKGRFLKALEDEIGRENIEQVGPIIFQHVRYFPLLPIKPLEDTTPDPGTIVDVLKKWLLDDHTSCVKLFLDLYRNFQEGKAQKDLAAEYGILPNALTKRLDRCRRTLRLILKRAEWN